MQAVFGSQNYIRSAVSNPFQTPANQTRVDVVNFHEGLVCSVYWYYMLHAPLGRVEGHRMFITTAAFFDARKQLA